MPELPEVEIRRQYLEATSLKQPITSIQVEDTKLLTTDYMLLQQQLADRQFISTERIGKNLFIYTDNPAIILRMHFGMTGDLAYYHNSLDRPRHARIVFEFASGFNLGFICPRKFERVGLVDSVTDYAKSKKLAPDALSISFNQFITNLHKRNSPIKPVLLDQAVVAGLGNWIVDEVLFQAKVHPEKRASTLNDDELIAIYNAIALVLTTAIKFEARYRDFPPDFLIHVRKWDDSPYDDVEALSKCPRCGTKISRTEVGGRTTFYCPNEQILS
ncbi:DNA-formamidopyrimidine glycosylase [Fibrella sp. HMF5335]|uniref:DNA-formamidopyrimidine glycosylase n=1 Tax=Fibrella rubiginis TaxID=2817060 RepID=A0A939GJ84_9BACT|nr:DNA-formamidopyrimidine glycosylase family protein [Fibrella rubiginis]MBO0938249.1 DNA-formamidopyrimidine glycosylase [Fibrella rubiginis]